MAFKSGEWRVEKSKKRRKLTSNNIAERINIKGEQGWEDTAQH